MKAGRWHWLHQVHGGAVRMVGPGDPPGADGDAMVATGPVGLAVIVADCAPVLLASPEGVMASVHCGWRGVVAGVVPAAVEAMRKRGAGRIQAAIGPCIGVECYEFGEEDLVRVETACGGPGSGVRATDSAGRLALDLRRAVETLLDAAGVEAVHVERRCTACEGPGFFSARARGEVQRQAGLVWRRA
ncbi:MAG: laccase domain-containing protein [Acidimicrobiales bacterium]